MELLVLTTEQKIEIYTLALKVLKYEKFICLSLEAALTDIFNKEIDYNYYEIMTMFPELLKHKPINRDYSWWPASNYKKRERVLKLVIKELQDEEI